MHIQPVTSGRDYGFSAADAMTGKPLAALQPIAVPVALDKGQLLYVEGDEAHSWYRLVSGVACSYKLMADGRRQIGQFLFAGDFFGFDCGPEHKGAVQVLEDAVFMRYPRKAVERIAAEDPGFARAIRQLAYERLDAAHAQLLLLGRKTATERLASFLIELMERLHVEHIIHLPMSRGDIGDYLGVTLETVSRTFSQLRKDGLISLPNPNCVRVVDRAAMEYLAEGQATRQRLLA